MTRKKISAGDLGIDVASGRDDELFKWFLASFLFGKRISQQIAAETYKVIVERHGCDTVEKLAQCDRQALVYMLGEGHYRRYDESTATRLLEMCRRIQQEYDGRFGAIRQQALDRKDLERRMRSFKGVGPKTLEIFMREARKAWGPWPS